MSSEQREDPVARNRAAARRHTPGRRPVSAAVLPRVLAVTAAVVLAATLVLLVALASR